VSFRSHRHGLVHGHRRHHHLPGSRHHHLPGSRHRRRPGRACGCSGLGIHRRHRGADCHRHTGCSAASGRPTAIAVVRLGADYDPDIHHHHHRSEATAVGVAGAGARAVVGRRLDNLGWAGRQTGSAAGAGWGCPTSDSIAVRLVSEG